MKQRQIINDISPDFKRDKESQQDYIERKKQQTVEFVSGYVRQSGMEGLVLGVSGGVDSFLAGALCAQAMKQAGKKLHMVILPNGEQADYKDAQDSVNRILEIYPQAVADTISIRGGYDGAVADLGTVKGFSSDVYTLGNLQPRLRMMYQYALAKNMLVVGTDHAAESITGFYTKYGDGGTDINPLQELVKDDIYDMAASFGAPEEVLKKNPAAGLGISADDESELGIKYGDICAYLKGNIIDADARQKLERLYDISRHKRALPASLKDRYVEKKPATIIVVDLIYAFFDEKLGELACGNGEAAVRNTVKYINENPDANVLYVRDWHPEEHCSFVDNGGQWRKHSVQGTAGAEFAQAFYTDIIKTANTPLQRYNVFQKGMDREKEEYSAIAAQNEAFGLLKDNMEQDVVVVGAATEYCVYRTVKDLLEAGVAVTVPESCLAYVSEEEHPCYLRNMEGLGVTVVRDMKHKHSRMPGE
ncbi:NAD(+) synthase [Christensenellaceae bacterium OttesenSCG-928-K19]|nr:NAD(+) synthase [Christensenellaceae bacterium OttesenSCG-928-K19]